jgi:hypothetical protein
MSTRASKTRAVRSSLAILLRIAVLFALTVLFLLPNSKGATLSPSATRTVGANITEIAHSVPLPAHRWSVSVLLFHF